MNTERVGSDFGGGSCSIFFSRSGGKHSSNRKNRCRKSCDFKPLSTVKRSSQIPGHYATISAGIPRFFPAVFFDSYCISAAKADGKCVVPFTTTAATAQSPFSIPRTR